MTAVDVVVLTWNDAVMARRAIASALASTGVVVRVIVVDNGSEPAFTLEDDTRATVLRQAENLGVAGGRNVGVRATSTDLVCVLDSDAVLEADCLAELTRPFEREEPVGLTAPVYAGQRAEQSGGHAPTAARKLARGLGLTTTYRSMNGVGEWWEVDFAIGACQLFRRAAFDAVGGMADQYVYGVEDLDFCRRLRGAGWRILQVKDARCVHEIRPHRRRMFSRRGARHAIDLVRYLRARRSNT